MASDKEALQLFQKLNNYFIKEVQARIEILLCIESDKSSFPEQKERFRAIFEIEVPVFTEFDIQKRMTGVNSYNIEKLKSLSEKEFFEGDLNIEFLGVEEDE